MRTLLLSLVLAGGAVYAAPPASAKSARVDKASRLHNLVETEVERALPAGLQMASLSLPSSLERYVGKGSVIALNWRSTPRPGRSVVQVLLHRQNGKVKKGWARIELVALERVVVANAALSAGSIIRAGQLRVEERPRLSGQEIALAPSFMIGSKVLSDMDAGDTLLMSAVSMPVPVERGASVRVHVRRGGVVVGSKGVLETKTMVGAPTRVRVAGRLLAGRLVASDLVELGESL